jgi:hypothetical protein
MRVDIAGNLPPNPSVPEAKDFIEKTEKFFEEVERKRKEKRQVKDEL